MIDFVTHNMAPLMFGGMILFMLIGYPAAFSLAAVGLLFAFIGIEYGLIEPNFLGNLTYQLFGIMSNDTLLAVPFFIFAGDLLGRGGVSIRIVRWVQALIGRARGSLPFTSLGTAVVFSAISGSTAATVAVIAAVLNR